MWLSVVMIEYYGFMAHRIIRTFSGQSSLQANLLCLVKVISDRLAKLQQIKLVKDGKLLVPPNAMHHNRGQEYMA